MIRLEALSFAYPGGQEIFSGFNWEVEGGHSWAVLGPSGCGKTTLLYLLAGLNLAGQGAVVIDGETLTRPRPQTGLVLQDYGLLPWATIAENISLGLRIRQFYGPDGLHAPRRPAKAGHSPAEAGHSPAEAGHSPAEAGDLGSWIKRLGLEGLEDKYPGSLSGGQRQRVAIARTLILRPDLLLMDEPFSSLDAPTRQGLEELTLQLWQEQRFTFVVVTHAIEEAAFLGQHVLVLGKPPHRRGKIFHNPVFNQPDGRDSEPYRELCRQLRACLEEL